ncbi:sulfurtransferase complex subunit TusB [Tropicimonas sp. TH_r6]|uniref:sulfurtransferase complex subunit TusB n=1 Tax=Tropicimonas sp. TH_r6 TaxID=3082085 RepID=UPI0029530E57|nr:sulfurtransferase complex subunit TusB [Tropicimonas sp. TH_r6]MDV7145418.1 sulfurtransferase complex subunit TusB [Tropicimonas sp. TH_r6]
MSTLHTVNKSPFGDGALKSCLEHCKPGDGVLLIEDGVYGALSGSTIAADVTARSADVAFYRLDGDSKARGLPADKLLGDVKAVGYDGFVDLVAEFDCTQSWL